MKMEKIKSEKKNQKTKVKNKNIERTQQYENEKTVFSFAHLLLLNLNQSFLQLLCLFLLLKELPVQILFSLVLSSTGGLPGKTCLKLC